MKKGASIEIVAMARSAVAVQACPAPSVDISPRRPAVIEVDVAAIGPRGLPGPKGDPGPTGPEPDTSQLVINGGYF